MKGTILSLFLVGAMIAAPALAQGGTGGGSGAGASGAVVAPSASPATGEFMGRHTMTGQVTKIDNAKGTFSLKTAEGTLDLHAPASALAGVKIGDQMSVEIAVKPMK